MPDTDKSAIVLCIGNELIADDAVGFEVYTRLRDSGVRVEYCSVGGIDMLPLLQGENELIVVDAVQLGAPAGHLHVLPWEELPANSTAISAHGLGLREAIEIGNILYPGEMPERVTLIGIEGRCFNRTRDFMTTEVAAAIDKAAAAVVGILQARTGSNNCKGACLT